jgi:hypothetical protein
LHCRCAQVICVEHDRQRISAERSIVKDIDQLERSIHRLHPVGGKRYQTYRCRQRVVILIDRLKILQIQYSTIFLNCTGTSVTTVTPVAAGKATRVEQVMALVRERIERRVLSPGARLTSVRAMAEATGFSKSTVVEAYARLVAERVIRSRADQASTSPRHWPHCPWRRSVRASTAKSIPYGCCGNR